MALTTVGVQTDQARPAALFARSGTYYLSRNRRPPAAAKNYRLLACVETMTPPDDQSITTIIIRTTATGLVRGRQGFCGLGCKRNRGLGCGFRR